MFAYSIVRKISFRKYREVNLHRLIMCLVIFTIVLLDGMWAVFKENNL